MNKETRIIDPDAGDSLRDLLDRNPNLFYARHLYLAACRDINNCDTGKLIEPADLPPRATIYDMLSTIPEGLKRQFMLQYIWHTGRIMGLVLLCSPVKLLRASRN
jgi:hypothetical protein